VEGDLPNIPVNWAVLHPQKPEVCYLATELGLFYTDSLNGDFTSWQLSNGFPNVRTDMLRVRTSDNTIVAGTHGRGLFTGKIDPSEMSNDVLWEERGPTNVGGRTRTIMIDPNDPSKNTIWAGSVSGGLWKTNNIQTVGIDDESVSILNKNGLHVFPNPFSQTGINIQFTLLEKRNVSLKIYDLTGSLVESLTESTLSRGSHKFQWRPDFELSNQVYLVVLKWDENQIVKKAISFKN
jgi:hypothetical protein